LIVGFRDLPVADIDALHRILTEAEVGVKSELSVIRGTELMQVAITPAESRPR
jgi:S1-C subfamily serine protease